MEKLLTIAVPAYNAGRFLEKCLSSLLAPGCLGRLEVIVIDDGSTDSTGRIADRYAAQYPETVSVIHKENGGHGSGINAAARAAVGKYFRVVDADDWLLTEGLPAHLDELERCSADVVVNSFHRVEMKSGKRIPVAVPERFHHAVMDMEQVMEVYSEVRNCFTIQGITYRLSTYRKSGVLLSEHVFYEDSEYITMPFCAVKQVRFLGGFLYQYMVGNGEQSISSQNQVKRRKHIALVIERLLSFRQECPELSGAAQRYYDEKLADVLNFYYTGCLIRDRDRKRGYSDMLAMKERIDARAPFLPELLSGRFQTLLLLHRLHVNSFLLDRMMSSAAYLSVRNRLKR